MKTRSLVEMQKQQSDFYDLLSDHKLHIINNGGATYIFYLSKINKNEIYYKRYSILDPLQIKREFRKLKDIRWSYISHYNVYKEDVVDDKFPYIFNAINTYYKNEQNI